MLTLLLSNLNAARRLCETHGIVDAEVFVPEGTTAVVVVCPGPVAGWTEVDPTMRLDSYPGAMVEMLPFTGKDKPYQEFVCFVRRVCVQHPTIACDCF